MHFTKTVLPSVPCRSTQLTADTPIYHRHLMMMPVQSHGLQDRDYSLFKARFAGNSSGIANSRTRTGNKVSPLAPGMPCKPLSPQALDGKAPRSSRAHSLPVPVRPCYQATQQSISGRILHINLQGANARQRHACSSNRFAADGMPDGRLPVCGRCHARRQAYGLPSLACQTAGCRFAVSGMPGCCLLPLRPGDEWRQARVAN